MINEYALMEAFDKIKKEMHKIKEDIKMLNEKLNDVSTEDYTEELIESNPVMETNKKFEEEINLTDSYY